MKAKKDGATNLKVGSTNNLRGKQGEIFLYLLFLCAKTATAFSGSWPSQFCLSICPSVTRVDQSKTVQARTTKSLPSAAWKTLVSGTVTLFHEFEGGHPERGR